MLGELASVGSNFTFVHKAVLFIDNNGRVSRCCVLVMKYRVLAANKRSFGIVNTLNIGVADTAFPKCVVRELHENMVHAQIQRVCT